MASYCFSPVTAAISLKRRRPDGVIFVVMSFFAMGVCLPLVGLGVKRLLAVFDGLLTLGVIFDKVEKTP